MLTRSSSVNIGALPGFAAIATTTRSKMRSARRTRSECPLVIGSKVPGYIAFVIAILSANQRRRADRCRLRQIIADATRPSAAQERPPVRQRGWARFRLAFHVHAGARRETSA